MLVKFLEKKAKQVLAELLDTADLDKNGVKDKDQVLALVDRLSKVLHDVIKAVDLPKVLAAVDAISKAVAVLAEAVDKEALKKHAGELKAIGAEILAFAQVLMPKPQGK